MSAPEKNGFFLISLDFELYWGVRDCLSVEQCRSRIESVHRVVPELIELFSQYGIHASFATVGMLMASGKEELEKYLPAVKPTYTDKKLSPYNGYMAMLNGHESKLHFAPGLIEKIRTTPGLEIGSHTFSHFYCLADGQCATEFEEDLKAHIRLAADRGLTLTSLVFPRNQYNEAYLDICRKLGIKAYRGNESSWIYAARNDAQETPLRRAVRLLDAYFNLSGHHTYRPQPNRALYNFPSSRFLRPASPRQNVLEKWRLKRIMQSMEHAAKNNEVFHLWWHPHNFGENTRANFTFLEQILKKYTTLNAQFGFESLNMSELTERLENSVLGA